MNRLGCLDDQTGLNTVCTNHHLFDSAVGDRSDPLQIRIEPALGYVMGMTDIAAHHGLFAAYFTHF